MTDIIGWVFGTPLTIIAVLFCWSCVEEVYRDARRKNGELPRCGWTNAYGNPCFLPPGHTWMCRVEKKSGRLANYYGVNFEIVDGDPIEVRH